MAQILPGVNRSFLVGKQANVAVRQLSGLPRTGRRDAWPGVPVRFWRLPRLELYVFAPLSLCAPFHRFEILLRLMCEDPAKVIFVLHVFSGRKMPSSMLSITPFMQVTANIVVPD